MRHLTSEQVQQYIAANVRRLRAARGLTQDALGEAAGLSLNYVQEIEAASKAVSLPALVALANALDVGPPDLLQPAEMPAVKRGRPRKAQTDTQVSEAS
ncbi:MAG TPA: helix-turn-helix transcriptional regulator, partial [Candidatus Nanopelagicales bacterium]|nr:helix-turn-helix transcriptional regulator [Candidatus Nanopelagicales bacterium]